ncbi:MAG: SEC-C metal-binding domain-containing protein [Myxococcota bacterium]
MNVRDTLVEAGDDLPYQRFRDLVDLGEDAVPDLVAVLSDPELRRVDGPADGYAPVHACDVLDAIHSPAAVRPLLEALVASDPAGSLYDAAFAALEGFGELALEDTLRVAGDKDPKSADAGAELLSRLGVRDARILDVLVAGLARRPVVYAGYLADYGDPAALPALQRALALQPLPDDLRYPAGQVILELASAIEALDGTVGATAEHKQQQILRARARQGAPVHRLLAGDRPEAPCWCGSGKRYAACHRSRDRHP